MSFTKNNFLASCLGTLAAIVLLSQNATAQTVKLHGAVTLEKLLTAQKAAIETQSGVKIEVVGNGTGRGLVNLCSGQADVALVGGPLKGAADAMNSEKAGSVDIAGLKEIPVTKMKLACVTHPSAGVKSLTEAQARDIFSGKVTNWKDVGGADQPVKIVMAFAGDGARTSVQAQLLKGEEYPKSMIVRNSAKDIPVVIAQMPGACTLLSPKNIEGNITEVALEKEVSMPLYMVVKGEPSGDVKKVVEAVTANVH